MDPLPARIQPGEGLDRSRFSRTLQLLALRVLPTRCKRYMELFRAVLLNAPRLRNIVPDPKDEKVSFEMHMCCSMLVSETLPR
jgi:hypothetical protein